MFTQVYFHKTRVAYDHHLQCALSELLPNHQFPKPVETELAAFLKWDDWLVLGRLANGEGGMHGTRLCKRDHFREVFHTPETPSRKDLAQLEKICNELGSLVQAVVPAEKSWYKVDETDILVQSDNPGREIVPLSRLSSVVAGLKPIRKQMVYCSPEDKPQALEIIANKDGRKR